MVRLLFLSLAIFVTQIMSDEIKVVDREVVQKDIQWNRYVTRNFEILSIDDAQGKYLYNNVEFMKTWIFWRWGLRDTDFATKCKIMCVPSVDLNSRIFGKTVSIQKMDNIWLVSEGTKWNVILPVYLTEVSLINFERTHSAKIPVWCRRGMSVLNGRLEDIKKTVSGVQINSGSVLAMSSESYNKLTDKQKNDYDAQAAALCLWCRKELGNKPFLDLLSTGNIQVLGLKTYPECDKKVNDFLLKSVNSPNQFFTW